jgi:hypothetical protein
LIEDIQFLVKLGLSIEEIADLLNIRSWLNRIGQKEKYE